MIDQRRRLKIALETRDVEHAVEAAHALGPLDLLDALDVLTLLAEIGDPRYSSWARRWVQRVMDERQLQPAAIERLHRLLRELPPQSEARGVTVALRSFARPARTWS